MTETSTLSELQQDLNDADDALRQAERDLVRLQPLARRGSAEGYRYLIALKKQVLAQLRRDWYRDGAENLASLGLISMNYRDSEPDLLGQIAELEAKLAAIEGGS